MSITQDVEYILSMNRDARNSDKALYIEFMQKRGMDLSPEQIARFMRIPSLESVRRTRQKIQEQGKYPADQRVKAERNWKSMRMQQNMPAAKPEAVERIVEPRAIPWLRDEDIKNA